MGYPVEQRQMQIQQVYEAIPTKVAQAKIIEKETVETTEVEFKPDWFDQLYVHARAYIPSWLMAIIVLVGLLVVFKKPVNMVIGNIFGVNFDDIKELQRRRKERDNELKKEKKDG